MIFLSKPSGFDIKVDNILHELIRGESVEYVDALEGTMEYVRNVLINRDLDVPEHLYRVYQDLKITGEDTLSESGDFRYDLLLMPPNVCGIEYVKTHGHKTPVVSKKADLTYPVIIEVLYGAATFILQKFSDDYDPVYNIGKELDSVYMMKAQKGAKVIIPPNYHYCLVNTRNTYLITGRLSYRWDSESERERLESKHGCAYYVIRKNARQEIVLNPYYKEVLKLQKLKPEETLKPVKFRSKKPLVEVLKSSPEKFNFLVKPQKVNWEL